VVGDAVQPANAFGGPPPEVPSTSAATATPTATAPNVTQRADSRGALAIARLSRRRRLALLVERDFRPDAPNLTWSADITYISTWEGFVYLAHVQDLFSPLTEHLNYQR
jgi:transposase InsO family protein